MGRSVRAKDGVRGVALPNGVVLRAGQSTVLADAQFAGLSAPVLALLDDLGSAADPASGAGSPSWLRSFAAAPDLMFSGPITRDPTTDAPTSAAVVWPDDVGGTYTALALSTAFPGAVDSYEVTYAASGPEAYSSFYQANYGGARTVTQPAVTRDASGAVTNRPTMVVT